jgi:hypothetical protein
LSKCHYLAKQDSLSLRNHLIALFKLVWLGI